jgi:hypothetical protein
MQGIYRSPAALFRAEMAILAHVSWVLVPLTLVMGGLALSQYLRRAPTVSGRYLHATLVLFLWLTAFGAFYYVNAHPGYAHTGAASWLLDLAGLSLVGGSLFGLMLRHIRRGARATARTILGHWFFAACTSFFLLAALWPYR